MRKALKQWSVNNETDVPFQENKGREEATAEEFYEIPTSRPKARALGEGRGRRAGARLPGAAGLAGPGTVTPGRG